MVDYMYSIDTRSILRACVFKLVHCVNWIGTTQLKLYHKTKNEMHDSFNRTHLTFAQQIDIK